MNMMMKICCLTYFFILSTAAITTSTTVVGAAAAAATEQKHSGTSKIRNELSQGNWMSLNDGSGGEVLLADDNKDLSNDQHRALREVQRRFLWGNNNSNKDGYQIHNKLVKSMTQTHQDVVDSSETLYSAYSQAWRLLGMYIDCNAVEGDGDDDDGAVCQRYLLWAAYVDLDYSGGGLSEYQFWNQKKRRWNKSACGKTGVNNRCVPMDCHLPDTHFSLIGYFKAPEYAEWMEQLFEHEGACVWNSEGNDASIYYDIQDLSEIWPYQCTEVGYGDEVIYIDVKPMPNARMDIGLYTDQRCSIDYNGEYSVEEVLNYYQGNNDNGGDDNDKTVYSLEQKIDLWNDYWDTFKYCHPCKAYDLSQTKVESNNDQDQEEYEYDDNRGLFTCDDDEGNRNVNQCMLFRTQTELESASFSDVMLGIEQGTLTSSHAGGRIYGNVTGEKKRVALHLFGWIFFLLGAYMLYHAKENSTRRSANIMSPDAQAPLIGKGEVA